MARVTVEDCLDQVQSHFELTLVAAKRAKQLLGGVGPSIETGHRNDKPTVIALREIAAGLIDPERVNVLQASIEAAEVFEMRPTEDDFDI